MRLNVLFINKYNNPKWKPETTNKWTIDNPLIWFNTSFEIKNLSFKKTKSKTPVFESIEIRYFFNLFKIFIFFLMIFDVPINILFILCCCKKPAILIPLVLCTFPLIWITSPLNQCSFNQRKTLVPLILMTAPLERFLSILKSPSIFWFKNCVEVR